MKTVYLAYQYRSYPGAKLKLRAFVWIGLETDPNIRYSRIYQSEDYPKMLSLANSMADEHHFSLTCISLDISYTKMYIKLACQGSTQVWAEQRNNENLSIL
jgi:hypothetical protein